MVLPENPVKIMIFPLQALKVIATYIDIRTFALKIQGYSCTSKIKKLFRVELSNSKNQILQS